MKRFALAVDGEEKCAAELAAALSVPGAVGLTPTETVYGLVGRVGDAAAFRRIFELKRRSAAKVLGWFVFDWRELAGRGVCLTGWPERLAERFLPGPLTIIAPGADGTTVGFRSPDFPLLRRVLRLTGPLYQTSANLSGRPDPRTLDAVLTELTGEVDCALDGGTLPPDAVGSTVVDATGSVPQIRRQGALKLDFSTFTPGKA